jgi:hypothetical protein
MFAGSVKEVIRWAAFMRLNGLFLASLKLVLAAKKKAARRAAPAAWVLGMRVIAEILDRHKCTGRVKVPLRYWSM